MRNQIDANLWKVTGLVAIGLLIATFILAYQAWNLPEVNLTGKVTNSNPTIYLRAEPSASSKIVTILERGSPVRVIDTVTDQNIRWMKLETGYFTGWLPESNIVFDDQ